MRPGKLYDNTDNRTIGIGLPPRNWQYWLGDLDRVVGGTGLSCAAARTRAGKLVRRDAGQFSPALFPSPFVMATSSRRAEQVFWFYERFVSGLFFRANR
jgi:hypothetical protein